MQLRDYAESKTYFNLLNETDDPGACPIQSRLFSVRVFFELLLILPFGLGLKLLKTVLRGSGLLLSGICLFITLGTSNEIRELFVRRVASLARDFADWALLPFALILCIFRLLAALVYPPLFLRF